MALASLSRSETMTKRPKPTAKKESGEFARFDKLVGQVLSVPHSALKKRLEEEKASKPTSSVGRDDHQKD